MVIYRDFEEEDIKKGLLETLKEVWHIDNIEESTLNDWLLNDNHMIIAEINGEVIGTATLHIQKKLIRNGGIAGLIEEVAVREKFRGNNIGFELIQRLISKAKNMNCYKIILSCFPERISFYERNGFFQESTLMRYKN